MLTEHSCRQLHTWANGLRRFHFPFDAVLIPRNGLYILFEQGEGGHDVERIVRMGTHTGEGKLAVRLREHLVVEKKDRSIFRKNVGLAILNKARDPFLSKWKLDLTSKRMRDLYGATLDVERQNEVENEVSAYMRKNFSFSVIEIDDSEKRLAMESKMISTVSSCEVCQPSAAWLGLYSPKVKIRESGLWQVNELYKIPLTDAELKYLCSSIG